MMRLTDAAADRIKSVMANAGRPIVGVRVGVKNGGCAGMAYTMEYAEQVEPSDEVVEDKGVRTGRASRFHRDRHGNYGESGAESCDAALREIIPRLQKQYDVADD